MTSIKINEHELDAMRGMPHWHRSLYLFGIRPYADYETGRVGQKRRISYQSLREAVEVTPTPGTNEGFYPGRQQIKRALKRLESAGLITLESERKQLILRVELMDTDECGGTQADTWPTHGRHNQGDTEADTLNPANIVSFWDRADTQADTRPTQEASQQADTPSGVRGPGNTSPHGDEASAANGPPDCPHQQIIELYHQILPMCQPVKVWNDQRKGYLRARWREKAPRQDLAFWEKLFTYIRDECPFLTGQVETPRGTFRASLEWILRPNNFAKIIEGQYDRNRDAS